MPRRFASLGMTRNCHSDDRREEESQSILSGQSKRQSKSPFRDSSPLHFPRNDTANFSPIHFPGNERDLSFRTHVRNLESFHSVNVNVKVKVLSEIPRRFAFLGMTYSIFIMCETR